VATELEIMQGRRAFPETQRLWLVSSTERAPREVAVGWHEPYDASSETIRETGAFALVRADGPYADLVGEFLMVTVGRVTIVVYCLGAADVPSDISLTRRAFLALGPLWEARLAASVVIGR
jgi:hypothetical protein